MDLGTAAQTQLAHTGTLAGWVKCNSLNTYDVVIDNADLGTDRNGYGLVLEDNQGGDFNRLEAEISNASATNLLVANDKVVTDTNWHHVAFTWDGSILRAYLDGVASSITVTQTIDATYTSNTKIGVDPGGNFCDCILDDVRIYNRALSATEVKELYNLGTAKITTH